MYLSVVFIGISIPGTILNLAAQRTSIVVEQQMLLAEQQVEAEQQQRQQQQQQQQGEAQALALVIDGKALSYAMSPRLRTRFLQVGWLLPGCLLLPV